MSHLARFVVIIWCFVVLILTQSYSASLASMLTIQQLEPAVSSVRELTERGENVGYAKGSFIHQLLIKQMNFSESQLKVYDTLDELDDSFSNGGISAAFGEIPYMKLFLAKHCSKYTMVSPTIKTDGFGFVCSFFLLHFSSYIYIYIYILILCISFRYYCVYFSSLAFFWLVNAVSFTYWHIAGLSN